MKNKYKLHLLLGLLLTATSQVYSYEEELVNLEIQSEIEQVIQDQQIEVAQDEQEPINEQERIQKEIDQELFELFEKFFNESNPTPFSKIISKMVSILKIKRGFLVGQQQTRCDELIKIFEKNKYNTNFPFWAKNLIDPDLRGLMSQETRNYINSVSWNTLINALRTKLHNNKH